MEEKDLTYKIIGAAYEVRKTLGKYLYEEVYEEALQAELKIMGIESQRQVFLPVVYKGIKLEKSYKLDLLVENKIPIELKALRSMGSTEFSQLMSYLVFGQFEFGFLMNFGATNFTTDNVP